MNAPRESIFYWIRIDSKAQMLERIPIMCELQRWSGAVMRLPVSADSCSDDHTQAVRPVAIMMSRGWLVVFAIALPSAPVSWTAAHAPREVKRLSLCQV